MGRRTFVRDAVCGAMATVFVPPLLRLTRGGPGARPFHIVVLGDSIAWGQGLTDSEKYATLVQDWLAQRLGRPVATWMFAHSGAVIGPDPSDASAPALPSEVPARCPSVMAQLASVPSFFLHHPPIDVLHDGRVTPDDVGLVLLDGGINDVNVRDILTMDPTITNPDKWIRGLARTRCVERMRDVLLPRVLTAFPNAQVIVTGYYAIVSAATRLGDLEVLLHDLGVVGLPAEWTINDLVRQKLASQCSAFYDETAEGLRAVIPVAEPLRVALQGRTRATPQRAHFVDLGLTPTQAFGASDTVLWGVPASDPLAGERRQACDAIADSPEFLICVEASAGHPNVDGARLIAGRIIRTLETRSLTIGGAR